MIKHSPDHAERAQVLARECMTAMMQADPRLSEADFRGSHLVFGEACVAFALGALQCRDIATVQTADLAAIDAILNRWRLNDDTARPSVKLGLLRRLRAALHDAKEAGEQGCGEGRGS